MAKDLFLETMSRLREYRLNEEVTEEEAIETLQAIDNIVDKALSDAGVPEEVEEIEGEETVETEIEDAEEVPEVELEGKKLNESHITLPLDMTDENGHDWTDERINDYLKNMEKEYNIRIVPTEDSAFGHKIFKISGERNNIEKYLTDEVDNDEIENIVDENEEVSECMSKELNEEGSTDLVKRIKSIRAKREIEESISDVMKKSDVEQAKELQLEEKSFDKFLTKFVTENYKNTESMTVKGARLNNDSLKLECEVKFKSGNTKMIEMKLEGIIRTGKPSVLRAKDNGFFKVESKSAPFKFGVILKEGVLHCNSLSYKFETRIDESKKAEVKGRLVIKESLKK